MSVIKDPRSPYYRFDFRLKGRRFFGSTKATNKKDALEAERLLKAKAKLDLEAERRTGNAPITFDMAAGRYWQEVGQHHRDAAGTWHGLHLLGEFFGKTRRLDAITDDDVAELVAWRRAHKAKGRDRPISAATVNRSAVEPLRKVFRRAVTVWRYALPNEPIWRNHRLGEPAERVRELHASEAEAIDDALRPDFEPWFRFASATGLRLAETLLRWDNVNWEARTITTTGKGGRPVSTPITVGVAAILEPLKGHHAEHVFTYVCRRPKKGQVKGQRYPITYTGAKSEWQRLRGRAGVKGFRFHDVRHDMATKLLRATGNLKLVSRALNHSDVKTTARYAHVLDDEVADALQSLAEARNSPKKSPTAGEPAT
jgi:integrase